MNDGSKRGGGSSRIQDAIQDATAQYSSFSAALHPTFAHSLLHQRRPQLVQERDVGHEFVINRLHLGLRLAVFSNWDDRLPGLLRALGLAEWFDVTVVSGGLGRHKPDPTVFEAAIGQLGLRAEQVLHVGDDFEADVRGARKAGLRAGWLRRGNTVKAADEIADLAGLLPSR